MRGKSGAFGVAPAVLVVTKPMYGMISDPRVGVTAAHESAAAAMCVRLVDVSGILAIHIPTRSLLRSSSTHEPSDPPLRVVLCLYWRRRCAEHSSDFLRLCPGRR
jgi:hypothetical protein